MNRDLRPVEAECFISLASEVERLVAAGSRKLLVTSSGPGEGKSTITAELGRALARSGRRGVVVVDADQFRPKLHTYYGVGNTRGVSELLNGVYRLDLRAEEPGDLALGDWLELLYVQARSGQLLVTQDDEAHVITLRRGVVTSLVGRNISEDRRIGSLLVNRGLITPSQRDAALHLRRETGEPLGQVAVHMGYLEPKALQAVLRAQFTERLQRIRALRSPTSVFSEAPTGPTAPWGERRSPVAEGLTVDDCIEYPLRDYFERPFLASRIRDHLKDTEIETLKILTAGRVSVDLLDGANSAAFRCILDHLSRMYDVVLVDSPPVAVASPAESLARTADGVLLVVKADGFSIPIIQRAKQQLEEHGCRLLGVVLNHVDFRHADPTLYYYYGYRRA